MRDVCRFTDGSVYDGRAIADGGSCPYRKLPYGLCGGSCGSCGLGDTYCVGRSSTHPFGVCMFLTWDFVISHCDPPCGTQSGAACAVMSVSADDRSLARRFGVCMAVTSCLAIAPKVVGGMTCEAP